ncbi:MAG: MFS transporter [Streptosporangiales bacterium]|nr:MFS transporter [Streptosporangiales bacterium]
MASRSRTIGDEQATARRFSWPHLLFILLLLDIAYIINAMDRQVFPVLISSIAGDLDFSAGQAGFQTTIFTLGMGLAAIPAGYIADRIGRKNMILCGLVTFSMATCLQGLTIGFADMAVYRILAGAGEGIQNAALYAAVGAFFHRNRAMSIGTLNAAYGIGAFCGPLLGNALREATQSWRVPLFVFAAVGLVILVFVLVGVPRSVADFGQERKTRTSTRAVGEDGGRLFNRNVVCCSIVTVVSGFAVYGWLGLFPTFLEQARDFTSGEASLASGVFGIGALFSIFLGMIADRWDQKRFNMIGLVGLMLVGGLTFTAPIGVPAAMALAVLMGVCLTGILYTNTNSLMQRSVPAHRVSTVVGVFVAGFFIPASVAGYFFATVQQYTNWATAGLVQMVAIPAIGLVAMMFVRKPEPARVSEGGRQ